MISFLKENSYRIILQTLLVLLSYIVATNFGEAIPYEKLDPTISTLQNVSAAVFTLAGIWIAYSYPEAIASFTDPKKINIIKGTDNYQRIKSLVLTILASSFVLINILLLNLIKPILESLALSNENQEIVNMLYLGVIVYLALTQLYAISKIMLSNFSFVYNISKKKTEREIEEDLNK